MTTFWIICALLLAVAVPFFVVPLWRSSGSSNHVLRDAANLEIFRDQMAEMDADLGNGLLTPELYEQGKHELQARLLDEVKTLEAADAAAARNPHRMLAIVLAALLPLLAAGLYLKTGNLGALLPQTGHTAGAGFGTVSSAAALQALEDKVAKNPQDANSIVELARSYYDMERYEDSAKLYERLSQLVPDEAQVWTDYADALAMVNQQSLLGQPTKLLDKALKLDPKNSKALALAGAAAMERGDYPAAIEHWGTLQKQLPKGSDEANMIEAGMRQARDFMAQLKAGKQGKPVDGNAKAAAGAERISGTVSLGGALKAQANPDDTVFILARAVDGPPMPLAVIRAKVKDLPMQFALDDSMAMSQQMKLSRFGRVEVVARISKSGNAMPQPGDLQGVTSNLKPGTGGVKLSIDSVVK